MEKLTNPHASDPRLAAAFELGYLAGFHDPAGNAVDFRPLAPDLLEAFVEGADAGREQAHATPGGDAGRAWLPKSELAPLLESDTGEAAEHLASFVVFKALEIITKKAVFGLIDLVITAVGIQGNVSPEQLKPLEPLEDDFSEDFSAPDSDSVFYVPGCPRTDHAPGSSGVAPEGFWCGVASHELKDTLRVALAHEHREALVARCDSELRSCGVVWVAKPTR